MYISIYIHVHMCMYIYIYIMCVFIDVCIDMCAYMYTCRYVYVYMCMGVYVYMCICAHGYTCMYVYMHMYMHLSMHLYVYIYMHPPMAFKPAGLFASPVQLCCARLAQLRSDSQGCSTGFGQELAGNPRFRFRDWSRKLRKGSAKKGLRTQKQCVASSVLLSAGGLRPEWTEQGRSAVGNSSESRPCSS